MPKGKITVSDMEIIRLHKKGWFNRQIQKVKHASIQRIQRVIKNAEN